MLEEENKGTGGILNTATKKVAVSGALIALDVLMTRILAINTPIMKIGLGFLAVALCGALYGPWWSGTCGALADILGSVLFPTGAYFPGFTITAAITGVIFGMLLRPFSKTRALAAAAVNSVFISFLANTYLISYISGSPYIKLLAARAVQLAVMLPIQGLVLYTILPIILKKVKKE